jgi:SAM-dependent methyltransferase
VQHPFFGELYLRSTKPFLPESITRLEADYLTSAFAQLEVDGPIADIGCGHGRHLKWLDTERAKIGLDMDLLSLREAQQVCLPVRANFFGLPFRTASLAGGWSWYNTLFTFDDDAQRALLKDIARCLKPGGLFIIQSLPREYIEERPVADYDGQLPDGSRLIEKSKFNPANGRDEAVRTLITPDGRTMAAAYFIRYYFRHEMVALVEGAGFKVKWMHGGIDGSPHAPDSQDLIVGAERV